MTIHADLRTFVLADATVSGLIGTRMYDVQKPLDAPLPCLTYRRVDALSVHSHDGDSGLRMSRWQFDCWATTRAGAEALAVALRRKLSGYMGNIGVSTRVSILALSQRDDHVAETGTKRVICDFSVEYEED